MATRFAASRARFVDCQDHGAGSGAELLLVEGDSALSSVSAVRNSRTQGVLALQGKPLNAWQAPQARVAQHAQYRLLAEALGLADPTKLEARQLELLRFERVALLFDPDADGIHIGALMLLYVKRWLPALIDAGRLVMLRAPMFELVSAADGEVLHADHPGECRTMAEQLRQASSGQAPRVQAHRGLGSIAPAALRQRCVDPATRVQRIVGEADVQSVLAVFGGGA
jgi:DNA gyrase subunit B/topoisomerase-4 subunit B